MRVWLYFLLPLIHLPYSSSPKIWFYYARPLAACGKWLLITYKNKVLNSWGVLHTPSEDAQFTSLVYFWQLLCYFIVIEIKWTIGLSPNTLHSLNFCASEHIVSAPHSSLRKSYSSFEVHCKCSEDFLNCATRDDLILL